jgi:hypothetical protein
MSKKYHAKAVSSSDQRLATSIGPKHSLITQEL